MKRWSSLQRELYKITDASLDFQIHLSKYRMDSRYGSTDLPRYWITLGGEIIFDYPRQFVAVANVANVGHVATGKKRVIGLDGKISYYPYCDDISDISGLIREYIDTPKDEIVSKRFERDRWGLTDILKAADRRIGARRLEYLASRVKNPAALRIIASRAGCRRPAAAVRRNP